MKSFEQEDRARFLQFVTGTSRVPLQGFSSLEGMNGPQKFQIHRDDRSTERLPCAHTWYDNQHCDNICYYYLFCAVLISWIYLLMRLTINYELNCCLPSGNALKDLDLPNNKYFMYIAYNTDYNARNYIILIISNLESYCAEWLGCVRNSMVLSLSSLL